MKTRPISRPRSRQMLLVAGLMACVFANAAEFGERPFHHAADGTAAQEIVKFIEKQDLLGLEQRVFRIRRSVGAVSGKHSFGLTDQLLGAPVVLLMDVQRGVAADGVLLQLGRDDGKFDFARRHRVEEGARMAEHQLRVVIPFAVFEHVFDLAAGGAAAVISGADHAERVSDVGRRHCQRLFKVAFDICEPPGGVVAEDAGDGDAVAVRRHPLEEVAGELHLMHPGAAHDIRIDAAGAVEIGQRRGVSEAVDVVADGGLDAQLLEGRARYFGLPAEAVGGGAVAVGLDIPVADDLPPAGRDVRFDAGVDLGGAAFEHVVEPRFAAGDEYFRIVVEHVAGTAGGGDDFVDPRRLVPKPNRIEMRVEYDMDFHRTPPL